MNPRNRDLLLPLASCAFWVAIYVRAVDDHDGLAKAEPHTSGRTLRRGYLKQVSQAALGQFPIAGVLGHTNPGDASPYR